MEQVIDVDALLRCPERDGGLHGWGGDGRNSCRYCGRPGRDNQFKDEKGGMFAEATAARAELFSRLRQPDSVKGWGKQW